MTESPTAAKSESAKTGPDASTAPTAAADAAARAPFSLRFTARDLVNVAIFAVIYFVIEFAISMLGVISPLVLLLTLPLSIIIAGVPYMLFVTRIRHAGMVTLFGIVVGLLNMLVGLPLASTVLTIVVAIIADAIIWAGKHRSKWAGIWSYAVFSIWFIGPLIPLMIDREAYLATEAMQVMGAEYVAEFDRVVSVPALWMYGAATVLCGVLGGLLGSAILRKHFVRAGLA